MRIVIGILRREVLTSYASEYFDESDQLCLYDNLNKNKVKRLRYQDKEDKQVKRTRLSVE